MQIPTLNVVDQAISEVQDKMKYFEGRSNHLLGEMSNAMTSLSGIKVDPVDVVPELPKAEIANFQPIDTPQTPDLSIKAPEPYVLDLTIEKPIPLPPPTHKVARPRFLP